MVRIAPGRSASHVGHLASEAGVALACGAEHAVNRPCASLQRGEGLRVFAQVMIRPSLSRQGLAVAGSELGASSAISGAIDRTRRFVKGDLLVEDGTPSILPGCILRCIPRVPGSLQACPAVRRTRPSIGRSAARSTSSTFTISIGGTSRHSSFRHLFIPAMCPGERPARRFALRQCQRTPRPADEQECACRRPRI